MFERPPFELCPNCGQREGLGLLSVGGHRLTMRCRSCRHTAVRELPSLNKRVIYLDQFAISNLHKVEAGLWPEGAPHKDFWTSLYQQVRNVSMLQQAIFPHSDIHSTETIISPFPQELRLAYEMTGGDVALLDTHEVQRRQLWECFQSYREDREPAFSFSVDEILKDPRNEWLSDMHISVKSDYSVFADGIRKSLDQSAIELAEIAKRWATEKAPFKDTLQAELTAFSLGRIQALKEAISTIDRVLNCASDDDVDTMAFFDATNNRVMREYRELRSSFEKSGVDQKASQAEVFRFWAWQGNWQQPYHKISAYMFAALARKFANGQRRLPSRGFMNDVKTVAAYAPYLDAMFIDNECAAFLNENPLKEDLQLKSRIFSLKSREDFLEYLREIERSTPQDIRSYAAKIYGVPLVVRRGA